MNLKKKLAFTAMSLSTLTPTFAMDVCETQYTLLHLAKSKCVEIERPIELGKKETFKLKASIVSKDIEGMNDRETIILVPGGPGESHLPLRRAMQKREGVNALWSAHNLNIVMFDPRGTGSSKLPLKTIAYGTEVINSKAYNEDLKALIKATSPDKPVILMAHSAGGHTALKVALEYPELVKKIILASASASPRQMALDNIRFFAKEIPGFMKDYFSKFSPERSRELLEKVAFIEDIMGQQYKARLLNKYVHQEFSKSVLQRGFLNPLDFRNVIRVAIDSQSRLTPEKRVDDIHAMIVKAEMISGEKIVSDELRLLKFDKTPMPRDKHISKEWIQKLIMCGEGLNQDELETPLYLDGRSMNYFCDGIHSKTDVDLNYDWLNKIQQPVLVLSGEYDTQVPISDQRKVFKNIPDVTFKVMKKGQHTFFHTHPYEIYKALEAFLN